MRNVEKLSKPRIPILNDKWTPTFLNRVLKNAFPLLPFQIPCLTPYAHQAKSSIEIWAQSVQPFSRIKGKIQTNK